MVVALEEVPGILNETIQKVIGERVYDTKLVGKWTAAIYDDCLTEFTKLAKPVKYVLKLSVLQRAGAGFHEACACFWDRSTDGFNVVHWENESVQVIATTFAVAM